MSTFDKPIIRKPATVLAAKPDKTKDQRLPEQLICPPASKVTQSDLVPITIVTSIAGLSNLPTAGAISFDSPVLQEMFLAYATKVFGVTPVALLGVPDVAYDGEWEKATWSLDHLAYDELVAELVSIERADRAMSDQAGARQKQDKRQQAIDKPRTSHFDDMQAFDARGRSLKTAIVSDDDEPDNGA